MARKNLYKATCLSELNKLASVAVNDTSPRAIQNAMDECFQLAVKCRKLDEEAAYILLMRYFTCYERLKQLAGNTVKSNLFTTDMKKQTLVAMDYLELLHKSLEQRYEAMRNKPQLESLVLPTPPSSPVSERRQPELDVAPSPKLKNTDWISTTELASRMRKKKSTLLLIDLRSEAEFEKCHIKWTQLINFPADVHLSRSTTFTTISSILSKSPYHAHWTDRGKFELIVLLDADTGSDLTEVPAIEALPRSHPLLLMKDAIVKWDATGAVQTEPKLLAGGMRDFLLRYAPLTSSPNHRIEYTERDIPVTGQLANEIGYPDIMAKDKEFEEAEAKRKQKEAERKQEAEHRRTKKTEAAAAAAAAASSRALGKTSASTHRGLQSEDTATRLMPTDDGNHGRAAKRALGDLKADQSGAPSSSQLSSDSPSELDLDERLRLLRVSKPKPTASITNSVTGTNVLQPPAPEPPKVDRSRKPNTASVPVPNASDGSANRHTLSEAGPTAGEPNVSNGLRTSSSSQELSAPFTQSHPSPPVSARPESDADVSQSDSAHSQPATATSNQIPPRHPTLTASGEAVPQTPGSRITEHHSSPSLLSDTFPRCHERPSGLRNLGNSCYMNAVIQSLAHTRALATFFLRCLDKELINPSNPLGYGGDVSAQFQRLFTAVWSATDCSPDLIQFKQVVAKHCSTFAGSDQQDSLEFLLFLLDGLHEDMNEARKGSSNRARPAEDQSDEEPDDEQFDPRQRAALAWDRHLSANKSVIVSSFQGQLLSSIECRRCHKRSSKFDAFMCLSLPLPSYSTCSLQSCMNLFGSPEEMEDQWFCPRCKRRMDATKRLTVWRLPTYLIIHLKRFRFEDNAWKKSTTYVNFPIDEFNPQVDKGSTYCLYAVLNHFGTMESGHYTAFCRGITDGRWFEYDDSVVTQIPQSRIQSSAAYILFYERLPRIEVFSKPNSHQ